MNNLSTYTVFILGAGLGTRLRPLTDTVPKVMVPIYEERPLLEHTITLLRDQGFRNFVVNLHYLPHVICEYFGDGSRFGVHIEYSDESGQLLETAGALKPAEHLLSDPFVLVYGDHLFYLNVRDILERHLSSDAYATIVVKRGVHVDHPRDGDLVEMDPETSRILRWHPRPHDIQDLAGRFFFNTGIDILPKSILDFIPANTTINLDREVLPRVVKERDDLFAYLSPEEVLDIGSLDRYEHAREVYKKRINESPLLQERGGSHQTI